MTSKIRVEVDRRLNFDNFAEIKGFALPTPIKIREIKPKIKIV